MPLRNNSQLDFSVIIPICHGGKFLVNSLSSITRLNYPFDRFEVIVAGHAGDIKSHKAVSEEFISSQQIIFIECGNIKRSVKLNSMCNMARGNYLVFTDDDCIVPPDWLLKFYAVIQKNPDAAIIGGQDVLFSQGSTFDIALDHALNSYIGAGGLRRTPAKSLGKYYPKLWNMAVRRDAALNAAKIDKDKGMPHIFNEELTVHEDVELACRIERSGGRILFAPEVVVQHCRDTTFFSFIARNFNMARICRSLGIHRLAHLALALALSGFAILAAASFIYIELLVIVFVIAGIYLAVIFLDALNCTLKTGKIRAGILVPILTAALHFARGAGYFFPLDINAANS